MAKDKIKRPKIHIGKTGGVRVDAAEFFAQPEVQRRREEMRKLDIAGKKLNGRIPKPSDTPSKKT